MQAQKCEYTFDEMARLEAINYQQDQTVAINGATQNVVHAAGELN